MTSLPGADAKGNVYGWVIVAITFLSTGLVLGSRFSMGMFLPYMPEALNASAADVSGAFAISMIGAAAFQPFAGVLFDRWGGRAVLSLGLASAALALCGSAFATALWQVILFMGVGCSIAYSAVSPVLSTAIVIDWFDKDRGAPLGVATSGTKVAMVVLPPVLAALIAGAGWRMAMFSLGALILLLIPVVWLLVREAPHKTRARTSKKGDATKALDGVSLRQALQMPAFWLVAVSLFANGQVMNLVFIHLPNYMLSQGYSEGLAAFALALLGGVGVFGTVVTGIMSDRIGSWLMLLIMFAARGFSTLLVIVMPGPFSMLVFVMVFGVLGYGAIGVIGNLAPQLFGKRAIGTILGTVYVFNQVGGAAGVYSGGIAYDLTGDYSASLWLSVATTLVSTIAIAFLPVRRGRTAEALG